MSVALLELSGYPLYIYSMRSASPPQPSAIAATLMVMPRASLKGRGTVWAIEHRFTGERHQPIDDGWGTLEQAAREEMAAPNTQIIEQQAKSILSGNDSPDIPFDLSINPYRGCERAVSIALRGRRTAI